MISLTESSARRSSSGPSRIASLKTSSSRRTGSMPSGSRPLATTSSMICLIFSRAVSSSPSRSTPCIVSRFMSMRLRSSFCICSCTLRLSSRIGSGGGGSSSSSASRATGSASPAAGSSCAASSAAFTAQSFSSQTRSIDSPTWTTMPLSSTTAPSIGSPLTYVPFALCRSSTTARPSLTVRTAWRSETSGKSNLIWHDGLRPIMYVPSVSVRDSRFPPMRVVRTICYRPPSFCWRLRLSSSISWRIFT